MIRLIFVLRDTRKSILFVILPYVIETRVLRKIHKTENFRYGLCTITVTSPKASVTVYLGLRFAIFLQTFFTCFQPEFNKSTSLAHFFCFDSENGILISVICDHDSLFLQFVNRVKSYGVIEINNYIFSRVVILYF